jgi:hypothetical protein
MQEKQRVQASAAVVRRTSNRNYPNKELGAALGRSRALSFVFVGKTIPLTDPFQVYDVMGSEHGEGPPDAVV